MAYDIRMVKLVTGELAVGKAGENGIDDPAILQVVPAREQGGMQMVMLPYGYPFEDKFTGRIDARNFLFEYSRLPDGLEAKYLEACTNLTLTGMGSMQMKDARPFGAQIIK